LQNLVTPRIWIPQNCTRSIKKFLHEFDHYSRTDTPIFMKFGINYDKFYTVPNLNPLTSLFTEGKKKTQATFFGHPVLIG